MAENQKKDAGQTQGGKGDADQTSREQPAASGPVNPGQSDLEVPREVDEGRRYVAGVPDEPSLRVELQGGSRVLVDGPAPTDVTADTAAALNAIIIARTGAMRFANYEKFIERIFCADEGAEGDMAGRLRKSGALEQTRVNRFSNLYAYELLKVATEAFLTLQCTDIIRARQDGEGFEIPRGLPEYQDTYL